jgi:hypothetical protein
MTMPLRASYRKRRLALLEPPVFDPQSNHVRPMTGDNHPERISRRRFCSRTALIAATIQIIPARVLGRGGQKPPSERLNLAGIECLL